MNNFQILFNSLIEFLLSKQKYSPRWDAAICDVKSRAMLFAYVPLKGRQAYLSKTSGQVRKAGTGIDVSKIKPILCLCCL